MSSKDESPTDEGLVICDKTARPTFETSFVSSARVEAAARELPELPSRTANDLQPRYSLTLSPASIQISRRSVIAKPKGENYRPRQAIVGWSKKSRASMVARLCSLDYEPVFGGGVRSPAMITLTYPGDWLPIAPDGVTAKSHLRSLAKRYERQFGEPLAAVWKLEFQRRGAPHFHLFCAPPTGAGFREWLSTNWTGILDLQDEDERRKHLLAGTGLDYDTGMRSTDSKRVAVYFSKHGSANFGDKEYQNRPPQAWLESGSIGRFWGYWGLKPALFPVEVSDEVAVHAARILRRWSRASGKPRRVVVWRVNQKTGELRKRHVRRRTRRLPAISGFVAVNDGSAMGSALARALALSLDERKQR